MPNRQFFTSGKGHEWIQIISTVSHFFFMGKYLYYARQGMHLIILDHLDFAPFGAGSMVNHGIIARCAMLVMALLQSFKDVSS